VSRSASEAGRLPKLTEIKFRNNNKSPKPNKAQAVTKPLLFMQVAESIFPTEAGKEHCFAAGVR